MFICYLKIVFLLLVKNTVYCQITSYFVYILYCSVVNISKMSPCCYIVCYIVVVKCIILFTVSKNYKTEFLSNLY